MTTGIDVALHSYSMRMHYLRREAYDVFSFIDDAVEHGFSGVNISLSGPEYRHLSGSSREHIRKVRDRIEAERLSLEVDTDSVQPRHLASILDVAGRLGAGKIRTFTHHPFSKDMRSDTMSDLKGSIPRAEQLGIAICLENHEEFTSLELAEIASTLDSPQLQLLFDFGNSLPVLERPEAAFELMSPWLGAVHVKDEKLVGATVSPTGVPTMLGVPLGEGRIDVSGLLVRTVEAGLKRVCLQNVWGYSVPLGKQRPVEFKALPSDGPFELLTFDGNDALQCFDGEELEGEKAVATELRALEVSISHLDRTIRDLGWATRRPLRSASGSGTPRSI